MTDRDDTLVWLLDADAIRVFPAGAPPFTLRPAAYLRDWIEAAAIPPWRCRDGRDTMREYRELLLSVYPEFLGRN
jgi:hypothetical protein